LRQSANIRKGETAGVALFFGQIMQIKHWKKFQHFKDRKPPWVKLYRDVLDDLEWYELDPLASKVLVMCWLIASEDDGRLPPTKTLAFRLRMTEKQTNDCLNKLSHWLDQDDINTISERYQDDSLETERETEKEIETEKKRGTKGSRLSADWVLPEDWEEWAKQERPDLNLRSVGEQFRDYWSAKAGSGSTKLDWYATWRNWVRNQRQERPNPADIAKVTVPSSSQRDPALLKIDEDLKNAKPNPEILRIIREGLKGKLA
jgi:hypothetical protein